MSGDDAIGVHVHELFDEGERTFLFIHRDVYKRQVSVDCGTYMNGFCGDSAYTFCVGEVDEEIRNLLKVTKEALYIGIQNAVQGKRIGDIGYAIQQYCELSLIHICMAVADKKIIEVAINEMTAITGQKAVATISRKDIANFKLRKKMPIGVMVTLRRERMYEFLEKLVRVAPVSYTHL